MRNKRTKEVLGRVRFYITKLSSPGWLMPNTVQLLKDCDSELSLLLAQRNIYRNALEAIADGHQHAHEESSAVAKQALREAQ